MLQSPTTFRTSRVEEAVDAVSRMQIPVHAEFRRPRSPFSFELRHVRLGSMTLCHATLRHDAAWSVRSECSEDEYHLQVSLEGGGRVSCGRREWTVAGRSRGLLFSPGRSSTWRGEGGFREISVNIPRRMMDRHLEALIGGPAPGPVEFEPSLDTTRGGGGAVVAIVREVIGVLNGGSGMSEVTSARYEEWLLDALLRGLPHGHSGLLEWPITTGARATVRQAEEYIEAHLDEALTIRRVALAIGVSIRTLQRGFARHREYTPKQFLAGRRLHQAREILLDGVANVTQAALASGHGHLGQFSVDYRRKFGESPSDTRAVAAGASHFR